MSYNARSPPPIWIGAVRRRGGLSAQRADPALDRGRQLARDPGGDRRWERGPADCAHAVGRRRALDTAFDRLGDAPSSSGEPGWCYWLDEAQAHAMAGFCYLRLQDWGRARQHLRTALRLQDLSCAREGSLRHILLAHTYLQQDWPEVDHAVFLASRAVETLSGEVDSARCRAPSSARQLPRFLPATPRRPPTHRAATGLLTHVLTELDVVPA